MQKIVEQIIIIDIQVKYYDFKFINIIAFIIIILKKFFKILNLTKLI